MEFTVLDIDWSKLPDPTTLSTKTFLQLLEVYIDDFITLIQSTNIDDITQLTRCLLHAITDMFSPSESTGSKMGPAISEQKLIAEGTWESRKEILGWLLDGIARTISLPTVKIDKFIAELKTTQQQHLIRVNDLHKLQEKLQFTTIGLLVGKPLLGPVDSTLAKAEAKGHFTICVNQVVIDYCCDWAGLLHLM